MLDVRLLQDRRQKAEVFLDVVVALLELGVRPHVGLGEEQRLSLLELCFGDFTHCSRVQCEVPRHSGLPTFHQVAWHFVGLPRAVDQDFVVGTLGRYRIFQHTRARRGVLIGADFHKSAFLLSLAKPMNGEMRLGRFVEAAVGWSLDGGDVDVALAARKCVIEVVSTADDHVCAAVEIFRRTDKLIKLGEKKSCGSGYEKLYGYSHRRGEDDRKSSKISSIANCEDLIGNEGLQLRSEFSRQEKCFSRFLSDMASDSNFSDSSRTLYGVAGGSDESRILSNMASDSDTGDDWRTLSSCELSS